jgi:hypothetical protein
MKNINLYSKIINECKILITKEINKIIGYKEAYDHDISILTSVKCQRTLDELNISSFNSVKNIYDMKTRTTIDGHIIDIIHENNETKLKVKTEKEGIVTKNLKYCKSLKNIERDSKKIDSKEIVDFERKLIADANAHGFTLKTPVICKTILSPIDKHWHNKSITVTQGEIMKIIDIDKKPGFILNKLADANGVSVEPDENNTKYKMEDCELAYNTTLTKLDEKKNKKSRHWLRVTKYAQAAESKNSWR